LAKEKGVSRRDFIKGVGGAVGLIAASSYALPKIFGQTKAAEQRSVTSPTRTRAWCMVIDLKKCDGCVTINSPPQCTQACIAGHYVPEGQQWIEVFTVELPGGGSFYMPTPCFQCENPPCVNVCPVAATYRDDDGIVLIDHRRCIGCRMCMGACPYHRRFFNWATPKLPPEAALAQYSPLYPVPAVKGTVIKCMFCAHMLRDGKLPYCVDGCPMKALYIGDLNEDVASNGVEVVQLSNFLSSNNAYRYKEELGTQPRVYYLPGHGENFGRKANDPRAFMKPVWSYQGSGYDYHPGVWPWGEEAAK